MQFAYNPTVKKCYDDLNLTVRSVKDIVYEDAFLCQKKDTCVFYIPKRYRPQNYVFALDLDNTLTYHETSLYVKHPDDIKLLPKRLETLQKIFKLGYTIAVFTNQATMNAEQVSQRMHNFLKLIKLPIYVFAAVKKDKYRKPETGMWDLFLRESKVSPQVVFFSGDALGRYFDFSDSDKEFAHNIKAKIKTPEEVFGEFDPKSMVMKKKELVVFVGAPGANKTSLYKQKYSSYVHVSKDLLKTKEMEVFNLAIKRGDNVVVDNTNPTKEIRNVYIDKGKKAGYSITILYFVKPGHNFNEKREKKVPDVVYHKFFKMLEPPTTEEGDVYLVY